MKVLFSTDNADSGHTLNEMLAFVHVQAATPSIGKIG